MECRGGGGPLKKKGLKIFESKLSGRTENENTQNMWKKMKAVEDISVLV